MKSFKDFLLEAVDNKKLGQIISLVKKINKTLPSDSKYAVNSWSQGTLSSGSNPLENSSTLKQLEKSFLPVKELMKTLLGSHIELYRGEVERSEENIKHSSGRQIYSWTASPKIASLHANLSAAYPEYTDDELKKTLSQFNLKGVAKLGNYQFIKTKDDPKYFNLYYKRDYQTGYYTSEIEDVLKELQKDNKTSNNELKKNQGRVYKKLIHVSDIIWIVDALNFKELEFIVKGGDRLT